MKTRLSIRWATLLLSALATVVTAAACGSSTGAGGAGTGGTVIVGSSSSSSTSTTSSSSTGAGTGGSTSCTNAAQNDCYSCTPTTNTELLNACNGQVCVPYDNSINNLPMLTADGGLPPITM
jgi:hypothetical protein